MNGEKSWVGVDICQAVLDVYVAPAAQALQYPNTEAGVEQFIKQLQQLCPQIVAFESTGGLERLLVHGLQQHQIPAARINPRKIRAFATAVGKAKTDALDAQVIAQFAQSLGTKAQKLPAREAEQLSELVARRRQLVTMRVAEKNRLSRASDAMREDISDHIEQLTERIERLERQIHHQGQQQADWQRKRALLLSVPGIGPASAALCLSELPELGQLDHRKIARLVGVAPINRDSGKHKGKRMISGGRTNVRCGLYMAALVAARHNPVIRQFYQRLRQRGKLHKVAITACIRKLIITLNAMIRDDSPWRPPSPQYQ